MKRKRADSTNQNLEVLYELFENNVNERNRAKILNAMADHPKGNVLAQCVFERAAASVFVAAKNQLAPQKENDEYGPLDSLLDAAYCKKILRVLGCEDYVINLLKDEFKRKYEREPDSLSDIVRILADRREIKDESAIPKATFEIEYNAPEVKIGSEWIISEARLGDDEAPEDGQLFVYKISRSSCITLEDLDVRWYSHGYWNFVMEPFLIVFNGTDIFKVHNLLKPTAPPMIIKRDRELLGEIDSDFWGRGKRHSNYDSDDRVNGELPESVLFPVVSAPNSTSVCIECAKIGQSSIEIVWKETFDFSEKNFPQLMMLDRDNYVVWIKDRGHTHVLHIILSKQKISRYFLADKEHPSFGLLKDRLVMATFCHTTDEENFRIMSFGFLTNDEEDNFQVACFLKGEEQYFNGYIPTRKNWTGFQSYDISIGRDEILRLKKDYTSTRTSIVTVKNIMIKQLLNFLEDESEKKTLITAKVMGIVKTKPLIHTGTISISGTYLKPFLENFIAKETAKEKARKELEMVDWSSIGRVSREKIEIFI